MQRLEIAATMPLMPGKKIAMVGGGAAGFFAAITCAESDPGNEVSIYERGSQFSAEDVAMSRMPASSRANSPCNIREATAH